MLVIEKTVNNILIDSHVNRPVSGDIVLAPQINWLKVIPLSTFFIPMPMGIAASDILSSLDLSVILNNKTVAVFYLFFLYKLRIIVFVVCPYYVKFD